MTWIRVECTVGDGVKVRQFAADIRVSLPEAVGHLVLLWGAIALRCPTGDVHELDPSTLEEWARWGGKGKKRGRFARMFRKRFVDRYDGSVEMVHDWGEHQGKLVLRRIQDTLRKSAARRDDVRTMSAGQSDDTVPYGTLRKERHSRERVIHKPPSQPGMTGIAAVLPSIIGPRTHREPSA